MSRSRKILSGILTLGLVGSLFTPSALANIDSLKNQQSEVREERTGLKSELTEAEKKVAKILAEIDELNNQIKLNEETLLGNQKTIDETEEQVVTTEEEIAVHQEEIDALDKDIDLRKELLKDRAITYQKNGTSVSYLKVILGAGSFSDFIERIYNVSQIAQADNDFMETLNNNIEKVEVKKSAVEDKLEELMNIKLELEGMNLYIEEQIEANNSLKKELKKKEEENREVLDELKDKDSQLAQREAAIRSSIRQEEERQRSLVSRSDPVSSANKSTSNSSNNNYGSAVIANGSAQDVINAGMKFNGKTRYIFGSGNPNNGGFDCSGFTSYAFRQIGVNIPRSSYGQATIGKRVSINEARPGDLIFFNTYGTNGHVGIYLGNGNFIGSQSSTGVGIASINSNYWSNAFSGHVRRVLN